jgi:hypothetical protein
MPFIQLPLPSSAQAQISLDSQEVLYFTSFTEEINETPSIAIYFKGRERPLLIPFTSSVDRYKVYEYLLETLS